MVGLGEGESITIRRVSLLRSEGDEWGLIRMRSRTKTKDPSCRTYFSKDAYSSLFAVDL